MLINYVLLPDEWDVVGAYKDIKTDAHQLRRGQEDVPMGSGDGFLQLLAPHLPVGGAEKAKKSEMPHAAGGKHRLPLPTLWPPCIFSMGFISRCLYPQHKCQASIPPTNFNTFLLYF